MVVAADLPKMAAAWLRGYTHTPFSQSHPSVHVCLLIYWVTSMLDVDLILLLTSVTFWGN